MKTKISYYLSHPIQYFSPLLKEMAKEFDLHVYYFSDASIKGNIDRGFGRDVKWDIPLLKGYSHTFLKNYSSRKSLSNRMWDAVNPSVIRTISRSKDEVIIVNGWSYFSTLLTIAAAKLFGKKVWLRAENPLNQELGKSKTVLFLKKLMLQHLLFPLINKFLYLGKESKSFFEYYGVKSHQLVYTPYAVDNALFQKEHFNLKDKYHLKQSLGLPLDKHVVLFTGKYIAKKRPLDLLKAFHLLDMKSAFLVMVGEGVLRNEMETYIRENELKNVVLTGFINQSEIPKYYAAADVFVMCSGAGETWGLSVNEAMNFALPVVISKTCGCAKDLVHENTNGFVFEEGNTEALRECLGKILSDEKLREQYGNASLDVINNYSISHIVQNMKAAVE